MSIDKGKARKILSQTFVENNKDVTADEARNMIIKAEQKLRLLTDEMNNDAKLQAAKQVVKDISTGYTSAIKYEYAKISFLLDKLEELEPTE